MKRLTRPLWVVLALIFLFEVWLWDSLAPIVGRIVGVIPWGRIKPAFVAGIAGLSPPATLIVFAIPFVVLAPVKVLEFWLFAHRHWLAAIAVLLLTKVVGLGLTAFIFEATSEKLLRMPWFRRLYGFFMRARAWAHARTEPVKQQVLQGARDLVRRARPLADPVWRLAARWRRLLGEPRHRVRVIERVGRIRRRMRAG